MNEDRLGDVCPTLEDSSTCTPVSIGSCIFGGVASSIVCTIHGAQSCRAGGPPQLTCGNTDSGIAATLRERPNAFRAVRVST